MSRSCYCNPVSAYAVSVSVFRKSVVPRESSFVFVAL